MYLHCWTEILPQDLKKQSAKFYFFRLATFFLIYHKLINTTPRDVTHVDDHRIDITQQNGRRQKGPFFCRCWVKFLEAEKLKLWFNWFVSTLKLRDTQFRFLKMKFFASCSDGFMGFLILKHTSFSNKANMDLTRIPVKLWGRGTFCIRNSQEWTLLVLTITKHQLLLPIHLH